MGIVERLKANGIKISMSRKGNPYDNIDPDKARELIEKAEDTIPSDILKESALFRASDIA